jgi:hypothetical protein
MYQDAQKYFLIPNAVTRSDHMPAKDVYFSLLNGKTAAPALAPSSPRAYLQRQLELASVLDCDLPDSMQELGAWMERNTQEAGIQYREYLEERKAGAPRRYFSNKSHALYFLKCVAPTKLVDGAWLYGLLERWQDTRFSHLIRIYLEELGEGVPNKNHVVLYRELLASQGCEQWDSLTDAHYVQGAIQLSLAHNARSFLPEVIGFNLGYEQLPLHLLITAYELNELGIDPYYFTLHVTVDNAATGHARKSVQGVIDAMPRIGDAGDFYRRVINGYKLNMLGAGTTSVISSFNLERELTWIFQEKCAVGTHMHSDYCRVGGRTVNDWLSDPTQIPAFLASLEKAGWIKRNQEPQNSRFWKLIQGDNAEMFGVFTAYEQQVIGDWISGDMSASTAMPAAKPRQLTYKAKQRLLDTLGHHSFGRKHGAAARGVIRQHYPQDSGDGEQDDFNAELRTFEEKLASLSSKEETMSLLTQLMSPSSHHTAPGLMATRIFARLIG